MDLYLLVASVVELHEVTTLKILGNKVYRTRQPLLGSVQISTGKQDAHDTKVTIQHEIQILWVQRKDKVYCEKAAAGNTNKLKRHATTSG